MIPEYPPSTAYPPPLLPRPLEGHKGTFGRVLIVAGSWRYPGAAVLAARGALRAGAGLVGVAVPACLHPHLACGVPPAVWLPLPATPAGALGAGALEPLLEAAEEQTALALGMGLSTEPETTALVHELLALLRKPLVLDADGLNALGGRRELLKRRPAPTVLTPHPGELSRLTGNPAPRTELERRTAAASVARETGAIVLLKGHRSIVTDGAAEYINTSGNPGMASGGMGDVLSGIIVALLGQGLSPLEAARCGAFVHGLAGDLAAERKGQASLTAEDVVDSLPEAMQRWSAAT
ncbi:MAG: NAD(P)H-hydrate dehydratase [Planctomycetota bacterium]